ncbi:UDP-N-acetylglucosamine-peptide N-acetylglucosaminyltransferase [Aquabacterium sp.]|uniref:O-linked N-acetylglucosamine transferase, SPINDLY family protein n=1 Tax=Aquabacterium sp. TaxID=1872578 RepID=UPI0025BF772D|nr:UDP-N-acetylglucosamine-peptide N-acetylglucosaminyltransferase [Aquabacterium sp.]
MRPDPLKHYARSRAWCEWDGFSQWAEHAAAALLSADAPALPPFHLLSLPGITPAQQQAAATRWMADRIEANAEVDAAVQAGFVDAPQVESRRSDKALSPGERPRIRLAYLSCDFHQHATALLMIEMLEAHDPTQFELHAYSYGADDGRGMRQRLSARFDHFTDIQSLSDAEAAQRIHADGIDILVDLKGYTARTRTMVLTHRPAPLQVNFLGYPGTLGGQVCDYLISDRFITPELSAADYSEALACLPHSYQPHGRQHTHLPAPSRATLGLPEDGLVLCCFNQSYKFTPEVFGIWCLLLEAAPQSVLWLLANPQTEGNLRQEALQRGIAPHRLVFAPDAPQEAHLARLQQADLVLDTAPYNAHTTASDALWAGVPVLTWAGDTFASRVAGSLLHAVGLPELVTHSLGDYAELALSLVETPERLQTLRDKLAASRLQAPLFDVAGYTRDIEALFTAMWARHAAGLPPAALGARDVDRHTQR